MSRILIRGKPSSKKVIPTNAVEAIIDRRRFVIEQADRYIQNRLAEIQAKEELHESRKPFTAPPINTALADALSQIRPKVKRAPYQIPLPPIEHSVLSAETILSKIDTLDEDYVMTEITQHIETELFNLPLTHETSIWLLGARLPEDPDAIFDAITPLKDLLTPYGFLVMVVGEPDPQGNYPIATRAFSEWTQFERFHNFWLSHRTDKNRAVTNPVMVLTLPYTVSVSYGNQQHIVYTIQALLNAGSIPGFINATGSAVAPKAVVDYQHRLTLAPANALSPFRLLTGCSLDVDKLKDVLNVHQGTLQDYLGITTSIRTESPAIEESFLEETPTDDISEDNIVSSQVDQPSILKDIPIEFTDTDLEQEWDDSEPTYYGIEPKPVVRVCEPDEAEAESFNIFDQCVLAIEHLFSTKPWLVLSTARDYAVNLAQGDLNKFLGLKGNWVNQLCSYTENEISLVVRYDSETETVNTYTTLHGVEVTVPNTGLNVEDITSEQEKRFFLRYFSSTMLSSLLYTLASNYERDNPNTVINPYDEMTEHADKVWSLM